MNDDGRRRRARLLVAGAFAVWTTCAAIAWISAPPLSHDEARYALAARDRVAGDPPRWVYVPIGMEVLAMPGLLAGGDERALRVVPALLGLAFLVAAWRCAAAIGDEASAAWTVAVLAGTTPLTRFQIDLLSDLPSAACLLALVALLVRECRGPTRWRVLAAAPLAVVALYVRYGSCVPLALIGLATLAFAGVRAKLVAVAAVAAAAAYPLVGALLASSTVPPRGGGLAAYAERPIYYFGLSAVPLVALALAGGWSERWRLYATVIGVADIVALGIETQAQTRYIALAIVLLVAVGAAIAREILSEYRAVVAVCAAAVIASWAVAIYQAWTARSRRIDGMEPTLAAAAAIRRDAAGRPCNVVGRHNTQLEWYSGCRAGFGPAGWTYVVRDDTGGANQPDLAAMPGTPVLHTPRVDVVRIVP
jgi:hypothetical protein